MHKCGGRSKGKGREDGAGGGSLIFAAVTSWSLYEKRSKGLVLRRTMIFKIMALAAVPRGACAGLPGGYAPRKGREPRVSSSLGSGAEIAFMVRVSIDFITV